MKTRLIASIALLLMAAACAVPSASSNEPQGEGIVLVLGKEQVQQRAFRRGETVTVRLRNETGKPHVWSRSHEACSMTFGFASGRTFLTPPGTHCDLVSLRVLRPGETVTLFTWRLDECVRDEWGCAESRPLPAGTYTIEGAFYPPTTLTSGNEEFLGEDRDARPATARVTFRIDP